MSKQEKTTSYMAELEQWIEGNVFAPLLTTNDEDEGEFEELSEKTLDHVRYAIRQKVLESYKNGCRVGAGSARKELAPAEPAPVRRERVYAQAKTR